MRRPPRSTQSRSSAASDVYKRQVVRAATGAGRRNGVARRALPGVDVGVAAARDVAPVSYTHLRAHETVLDLVCRLLLEKKKNTTTLHHT